MSHVDTGRVPSPRMSGAERRSRILDAAIEEFARVGYHGAKVAVIAQRADCSEPNLYKHFRDKRDLLVASLTATEELVEREIDRTIQGPDLVARWTEYANGSRRYRNMLMLRMLCSTLADDPEIAGLLRDANDRMLRRFEAAVATGQADGSIAETADPEYLTWVWMGMSLAAFEALAVSGEDAFQAASASRERALLDGIAHHRPAG